MIKARDVRGVVATIDYDPVGKTPYYCDEKIFVWNKDLIRCSSALVKFDITRKGGKRPSSKFIANSYEGGRIFSYPEQHRLTGLIESDMGLQLHTTKLEDIKEFYDPGKTGGVHLFLRDEPKYTFLITSRNVAPIRTPFQSRIENPSVFRVQNQAAVILSDSEEILEQIDAFYAGQGITCFRMERLDRLRAKQQSLNK